MARAKTMTAFQYDNASTGADHPIQFGVIPGTWEPGVPVAASAFGMSDEQLRDAIEEFGLPIVEVEAPTRKVVTVLDRGPNHHATERAGSLDVPKPDDRVLTTDRGPIPAAPGAGNHPPLEPHTAEAQARNTARSKGELRDADEAATIAAMDAEQHEPDDEPDGEETDDGKDESGVPEGTDA